MGDWSSIRITNLVGKVMYQEFLNNISDVETKTIDTSTLSEGVYLLQIEKRGKSVTRKFVVL